MSTHFSGTGNVTVNTKTAIAVSGNTTVLTKIRGFTLSNIGAVSGDSPIHLQIKRTTANATGTTITPSKASPYELAAGFTVLKTITAEPTYDSATDALDDSGYSARCTYRWAADGEDGSLLIAPSTTAGIGFFINNIGAAAQPQVTVKVSQ